MRNFLSIFLSILISVGVVATQSFDAFSSESVPSVQISESSLISQAIVESLDQQIEITKVYQNQQLIGILSQEADLDQFLSEVYSKVYQADFENSKLGFGEDITLVDELSYFVFENKDSEIFSYLENNDLFSIEVDKIEFSNGAVIYVKDISIFEEAKQIYISNFISTEAYNLIINNQLPAPLMSYGYREIGFSIVETASYQRGLAPFSKILKSSNEVLMFLSYGYEPAIDTYTVVEYDTVEGIGYKSGLSPQQIVTINNDVLKSTTQILEVGLELNVTYFDSPINVVVTKERLAKETVYPQSTLYIKDPTMQEGMSVIQTKEELGYKDVLYEEVYVNGVMSESEIKSSTIIKYPVREVMRIGTKVVPGIGSGDLRWPLGGNSHISCRWYCYSGHQGVDFVYNVNRYGPIYAADRGVIMDVGYDWRNGYHVYIDHNNGMKTLYAHMVRYPPVKVGQKIEKGDFIGNVGSTGRSTGPHLHLGVYVNGVAKNPCIYLGC